MFSFFETDCHRKIKEPNLPDYFPIVGWRIDRFVPSTRILAQSEIHIYIYIYIYISLVWFYGISTIVSYLMPNPFLYIFKQFEQFQTIQFSIRTQFSPIRPIDRTPLGATTPGQSGPRSDGNERVLLISQSSSIAGASLSDCFLLYHYSLGKFCLSAEMQSAYSIAQPSGPYIYIYIYI